MTFASVPLGELMSTRTRSIDPRKNPDDEFELFSIPAFDAKVPELVSGREVGSRKQVLESGDVLLSKIVPHIRRAWVVELGSDRPAIGSSEWIIFRSDRFDPAYLRYVLVSDRFHHAFIQTVAGVGGSLLRARPSYVADIPISLPALEEQRRIAAVLDAAEALRAKRRQALAKLDRFVEAVFADLFDNLTTLRQVRFETLMTKPLRNGVSPSTSGEFPGRVLTLSAITGLSFDPDAVKNSTFVRPHVVQQTVSADLFLICRGNGNLFLVGRGKYPQQSLPDVAFPDTMIAARCDSELISRDFLSRVWNTPIVRRQIESAARTTNGTHKINQAILKEIKIPIPALKLQRQFESYLRMIARQRDVLNRSSRRCDRLFASLQQRAFQGEL